MCILSTHQAVCSRDMRLHNFSSLKLEVVDRFLSVSLYAELCCTVCCFHVRKLLCCFPILLLNFHSLKRLAPTCSTLEELIRLMSEEDNSVLYQDDLELQWSTRTPCIPFLGYFLTQVVFVDSFHELRGKRITLVPKKSTTVYTELSAITLSNTQQPQPEVISTLNKGLTSCPSGCPGKDSETVCIPRIDSGSWEQYVSHQQSVKEPLVHPHLRHHAMSDRGMPNHFAHENDNSSRESSPDLDLEEAITIRALRRKRQTAPLLLCDSTAVSTPLAYLHKMQLNSLGCCAGVESRAGIRDQIRVTKHNTEVQNYTLSYEREPA